MQNTSPIFTATPNLGRGFIDTGNANLDGTGTVVIVLTAGANGTRVHRIVVKAITTTTAGMVRLFLKSGSYSLYKEIPVSAIIPSATVEAFSYTLELPNEDAILLPTGYTIEAATENSDWFYVFAEGADY
jgi:hypothetical protein